MTILHINKRNELFILIFRWTFPNMDLMDNIVFLCMENSIVCRKYISKQKYLIFIDRCSGYVSTTFQQQCYANITICSIFLIFPEFRHIGINTSGDSNIVIGWTIIILINTMLRSYKQQTTVSSMSKVHVNIYNFILLCCHWFR